MSSGSLGESVPGNNVCINLNDSSRTEGGGPQSSKVSRIEKYYRRDWQWEEQSEYDERIRGATCVVEPQASSVSDNQVGGSIEDAKTNKCLSVSQMARDNTRSPPETRESIIGPTFTPMCVEFKGKIAQTNPPVCPENAVNPRRNEISNARSFLLQPGKAKQANVKPPRVAFLPNRLPQQKSLDRCHNRRRSKEFDPDCLSRRSVRRHAAYVAHFSHQTAVKRKEEEKRNLFKARPMPRTHVQPAPPSTQKEARQLRSKICLAKMGFKARDMENGREGSDVTKLLGAMLEDEECAEVLDKMLSHPGVDMNVLFKSLDDQLDLPLDASKEMKTKTVSAFSLESAASGDDEASISTSRSLFGQQGKQANLLNKLKAEKDAEGRERAKAAAKCRERNAESWRRAQKAHTITLLHHQKEQEEKLKLSHERQYAASKKYRQKMQEIENKAIREGINRQNKPRNAHKQRSKAVVSCTPDPSTKSSSLNLRGIKEEAPRMNQAPSEEQSSKLPILPVPTLVNQKSTSLPLVENEEQAGHKSAENMLDNSQHVDETYEPYQIWDRKGEGAYNFFYTATSTSVKGRFRIRNAQRFAPESLRRVLDPTHGVTLLVGKLRIEEDDNNSTNGRLLEESDDLVITAMFDRGCFNEAEAAKWWVEHREHLLL